VDPEGKPIFPFFFEREDSDEEEFGTLVSYELAEEKDCVCSASSVKRLHTRQSDIRELSSLHHLVPLTLNFQNGTLLLF
jgi:hypothetical protein